MTRNGTLLFTQVIVVISFLLALQFVHLWEPEDDTVLPAKRDIYADVPMKPSENAGALHKKDAPEFEFSDMHVGHFTENRGQWGDHILFLARTLFGHVGFGERCVFYYLSGAHGGHAVRVDFNDAGEVRPLGWEDAGFSSNYFHGNDRDGWVRDARSFEKVVYENAWPGIDIQYYFSNGTLKYDMVVGEYANPESISFSIQGHSGLDIRENTLDIMVTKDVSITDSDLIAYYEDGTIEEIRFKTLGESNYGFDIDKDEGRILVIDPMVFSTSTFLGGSGTDRAKDVAIDGDGNVIILGETYSSDFPNTTGAYQNESAGTQDLSITKMDHNATHMIFSTYIGGWHMEFPNALDVDDSGDIYATGETWANDFPTTNGSFCEEDPVSSYSIFVVKLSSAGNDLIYSTYVGSSGSDWAKDIEVSNGCAHVVGYTYSYDFPFVEHPVDNPHGTAFVFILNQDGSNITHTDFWGGFENEIAYSLEVCTNGDVVVGGVANSQDFPTTSGVFQQVAVDNSNGFLLRFRPSTHTLIFSTFIGGSEYDEIDSIYLDSIGDVYFAGITKNPTLALSPFPITRGAYDMNGTGGQEAFIGKMSSDGSSLLYSTFFGGDGKETVGSIDVDTYGNVYFTGSLDMDVNFSVTPDAFDDTFGGEEDTVFAILKADWTALEYCTYLGGVASDLGEECLLVTPEEILVLGTTHSQDFPSTSRSFQSQNNGTGDIFLARFIVGDYIFLHQGWNLISVPLLPPNMNIYSVLSSIEMYYDAVQWYDPISCSWQHNADSKPPVLNTLWEINHHMGFWVHIPGPGGVLLEYSGDPPGLIGAITLYKGWNAVGYPSEENKRMDEALHPLTFGVEVDSIWYFDGLSQSWREMGPTDHFVTGRGYWIHATQDCVWTVQ